MTPPSTACISSRPKRSDSREERSAGSSWTTSLKRKSFARFRNCDNAETNAALREKQKEVASRHDLPIVRGRVAFPDLRIEYETRDGELDHRDLELATEHYRPGQLAQKRQAGFKIYFAGTSRSSGSTVKEERELTAEILR